MSIGVKRTWLTIVWIFMLVEGILLCCTIFGLPLGIPSIIGSGMFKELKNIEDDKALAKEIDDKKYFGWGIFSMICVGVIGVLGFIFVYCLKTEGVKQENSETIKVSQVEVSDKKED